MESRASNSPRTPTSVGQLPPIRLRLRLQSLRQIMASSNMAMVITKSLFSVCSTAHYCSPPSVLHRSAPPAENIPFQLQIQSSHFMPASTGIGWENNDPQGDWLAASTTTIEVLFSSFN